MSGRRPIGPVDTIWLNMDRPNNLMVVDMLMMFESPVDWERLLHVIQTRLIDEFPVFHQHPVAPLTPMGTPHWEDDPDFDLGRHITYATLPAPGDEDALKHYVEQRLHVPFAREHPLWEFHLIDGFDAGSVVFSRIHHSLADGMALAAVFLSLTDALADDDLAEHPTLAHEAAPAHGPIDDAFRMAAAVGSAVRGLAADVQHHIVDLPHLMNPMNVVDAYTVARKSAHVANKLVLGHNPETLFGGEPGLLKRVVWSQPVSLSELKHVGRLSGATLNDVLMSALAGAIATYLEGHGTLPVDLSTMVPANVRPPGEPLPRELGNQFALLLCPLASGIKPPLERLAETKRRMDAIKDSPEAVLTFGLINAIGRSGPDLERFFVDFFASKAIGVTTNVAGPATTRYLAGTKVSSVLGWVPGSGRQTLGVCIVTYASTVRVGFKVDRERVPDPDKLVEAFDSELVDLMSLVQAL